MGRAPAPLDRADEGVDLRPRRTRIQGRGGRGPRRAGGADRGGRRSGHPSCPRRARPGLRNDPPVPGPERARRRARARHGAGRQRHAEPQPPDRPRRAGRHAPATDRPHLPHVRGRQRLHRLLPRRARLPDDRADPRRRRLPTRLVPRTQSLDPRHRLPHRAGRWLPPRRLLGRRLERVAPRRRHVRLSRHHGRRRADPPWRDTGMRALFLRPRRQPQRALHRRLLVRPRRRAHHLDRVGDRARDLLLPGQAQPLFHDDALMSNDPDIRIDAPMFLARYREREAARAFDGDSDTADESLPLYLRQHRRRRAEPLGATTPLWQRASLPMQRALTEDSRNKEIAAPPEARRGLANDVFLIRHAETQGYSTDSGLTPQGAWQAHTFGHTLAKRIRSGETVVLRHADTNRARETAEHIERGLRDGLVQFEKSITIHAPEAMDEFRNFQFVSPDGLKDVTAAFREYYAVREQYERMSTGDRPLWLVEMDRFWKLQVAGGDPIEQWLTTPMLHFEPPSMTVRRFWVGINRLASEFPGARLVIPTHSGCMRAFAVAALGYDPGE